MRYTKHAVAFTAALFAGVGIYKFGKSQLAGSTNAPSRVSRASSTA